MGKGFGIAALVIAIISAFAAYGFNIVATWIAMICAMVGIFNGERPLSIGALVVAFVGLLLFSPLTLGALTQENAGIGGPLFAFGPYALPLIALGVASRKEQQSSTPHAASPPGSAEGP